MPVPLKVTKKFYNKANDELVVENLKRLSKEDLRRPKGTPQKPEYIIARNVAKKRGLLGKFEIHVRMDGESMGDGITGGGDNDATRTAETNSGWKFDYEH